MMTKYPDGSREMLSLLFHFLSVENFPWKNPKYRQNRNWMWWRNAARAWLIAMHGHDQDVGLEEFNFSRITCNENQSYQSYWSHLKVTPKFNKITWFSVFKKSGEYLIILLFLLQKITVIRKSLQKLLKRLFSSRLEYIQRYNDIVKLYNGKLNCKNE
jgi:hypothetical protein